MPVERDKATTVLSMVGLPARGKTYIGRRVARYLNWLGHPTRVFNVGSYRRKQIGASQPADFFAPSNTEGRKVLQELAMGALDDMLAWLRSGGEVGIFDATNSTKDRRRLVEERCRQEGFPLVFIESFCNDPAVIAANVRDTKLKSPDYVDMDPEDAAQDFLRRIAHYESMYETSNTDKRDIVSNLKKELEKKTDEILDLNDRLVGLQQAKDAEKEAFDKQLTDLRTEFQETKDMLTNQNNSLCI